MRIVLGIAILLAGCGSLDVRDQSAPDDQEGYARVFQQLDGDEKLAFSIWWNERARRINNGTAAESDFTMTVGEAIKWGTPNPETRAKAAAHQACFDAFLESARNSQELAANGSVVGDPC